MDDDATTAPREPSRWSMDVVLVCHVTPPPDELRQTVTEICGPDCEIADDGGRRVVTVESDAATPAAAVEALQGTAERLVERLAPYECSIELTSRLMDRWAAAEPAQGGSLGEGA
jgi:hypothetical protein